MSVAGLLDKTVTVEREQVTRTPTGATTRTWTPVATGVPCAIQQASGRRVTTDQGMQLAADWQGFFLADADLQLGDHVVDGAEVYAVVLLESLRGHHLEAALRQWTG